MGWDLLVVGGGRCPANNISRGTVSLYSHEMFYWNREFMTLGWDGVRP